MALLDGYPPGLYRLFAPRLIDYEIGNLAWKNVRRRQLTPQQAEQAFALFLMHSPVLLDPPKTGQAALQLAVTHGQTCYDSAYPGLAVALECELVTAVARFHRATQKSFPCLFAERSVDLSPRGVC